MGNTIGVFLIALLFGIILVVALGPIGLVMALIMMVVTILHVAASNGGRG